MSKLVLVSQSDLDDLAALGARMLAAAREPAAVEPPVEEIVVVAPKKPEDASFAFTDYGKFYDWLRSNAMLGPTISSDEFQGCDMILRACASAGWGISYTAYALATSYHETAHTMQPILEKGGPTYFTRMYDIRGNRPHVARQLGNLTPGDGAKYPGRGYVQLTGLRNYVKATAKLRALGYDVDLVADPDRAMDPEIAGVILVAGMEEGWFTGRKIGDDLPAKGRGTLRQFIMTRDVINGTDRDEMIAQYAMQWQDALGAGGWLIAP